MAKKMTGRIGGAKIATFEGFDVHASLRRAKRDGRDRIWFQIRQAGDVKEWRVTTTLAYAKAIDVQFQREPRMPARTTAS